MVVIEQVPPIGERIFNYLEGSKSGEYALDITLNQKVLRQILLFKEDNAPGLAGNIVQAICLRRDNEAREKLNLSFFIESEVSAVLVLHDDRELPEISVSIPFSMDHSNNSSSIIQHNEGHTVEIIGIPNPAGNQEITADTLSTIVDVFFTAAVSTVAVNSAK